MENSHDIFISYSSKDKKLAFAICHFLEEHDLRCWIAPRDILSGRKYSEAIVEGIENSKMMVVIFSESTNSSEHVHNEVECAFHNRLAILPFRTQEIIPSKALAYFLGSKHWLDAIDGKAEKYFDELLRQCMVLLKKDIDLEPSQVPVPKPDRKRYYYLAAGLIIIILALMLFVFKNNKPDNTKSQVTSMLITDMGMYFSKMDYELGEIAVLEKNFAHFISLKNTDEIKRKKEEMLAWIEHRIQTINSYDINSRFYNKEKGTGLAITGFKMEDVNVFYTTSIPSFWSEVKNCYNQYKMLLEMNRSGWPEKIDDYINYQHEGVTAYGDMLFYGYLEMVSYAPDSLKKKFDPIYNTLTHFPEVGYLTKDDAERRMQRAVARYQDMVTRLAALTGYEEKGVNMMELDSKIIESKKDKLQKSEEELNVKKQQLAMAYDELRNKCKISSGDEQGIMWNKIMQLAMVGLYDDVVKSFDQYLVNIKKTDPAAEKYIPCAKSFYRTLVNDKSKHGVMVIGFENNLKHSALSAGDIIISFKGMSVKTGDDYVKAAKSEGEKNAVFMHMKNGMWEKKEAMFKPDDPRLWVVNLDTKNN